MTTIQKNIETERTVFNGTFHRVALTDAFRCASAVCDACRVRMGPGRLSLDVLSYEHILCGHIELQNKSSSLCSDEFPLDLTCTLELLSSIRNVEVSLTLDRSLTISVPGMEWSVSTDFANPEVLSKPYRRSTDGVTVGTSSRILGMAADIMRISGTDNIVFEAADGEVSIKTFEPMSDVLSASVSLGAASSDADVKSVIVLSFFDKVVSCLPEDSEVEVSVTNDYPLEMDFTRRYGGGWELTGYIAIAPRVM